MPSDSDKEWLSKLKAGDEVFVDPDFGDMRLERVSRTTATQIHVGNSVYRRKDGFVVGHSLRSTGMIGNPDADRKRRVAEEAMRKSLREKLYVLSTGNLTITTVRKLLAVLAEAEQENKEGK